MKLMRVLFLICSLSLPLTAACYPGHYRPACRPVTTTYYHSAHCQCNYCYPYYEYNCPYCYDCYGGCPECDKTAGKIFLMGVIIATAAYLIDRVINS